MQVIYADSPDTALTTGLQYLMEDHIESQSRNGPVLRFPYPLTTVYTNPRNRVMFNPIRDCNPFLHLFESLWMLAGRNDVAFVSKFAPQMKAYSDDGVTLNGAYGYRWMHHFGIDQIHDVIIPELRRDPDSRRAHLQMWDGDKDPKLLMSTGSKDFCCNLSVEFEILRGLLNMVVFNRSNDLIWGAYGANLVHFSLLQEYVAGCLGVGVGTYYQVSRNAHIYTENSVTRKIVRPVSPSSGEDGASTAPSWDFTPEFIDSALAVHIQEQQHTLATPLIVTEDTAEDFRKDLSELFAAYDATTRVYVGNYSYRTEFMSEIVGPMAHAFELYKQNKLGPAQLFLGNEGYDWLDSGWQWLQRRIERRAQKSTSSSNIGA